MPYDDRRLEQYGSRIKGIQIIGHERDFRAVLGASTRARLYLITASCSGVPDVRRPVPGAGSARVDHTVHCLRCGPSRKDRTMNTRPIRQEEEIAIRQLVQDMQDAQNTKNGRLFASAFAPEHDYVAINGMFLPDQTRQQNARVHQRLYDESTSAVAGRYGEVEVLLNVVGIRLLAAPRVAIVHV